MKFVNLKAIGFAALICASLFPSSGAYADAATQQAIGQALSSCTQMLATKQAAAESLAAQGFKTEIKRKKRLSALKNTATARILLYIDNIAKMRSCNIETSPAEYGTDIGPVTVMSIFQWAGANKAQFRLVKQGQAVIVHNKRTFDVKLVAATFRGRGTANLQIWIRK
jgi:hypothetical protein